MGKYTDAAVAAYQAREQQEAEAEAAARQALIDRAKAKAAPLWTDATGKPIIDPLKQVRAEHVDAENGLVVLSVLDTNASSSGELPVEVSFAVYPDSERPPKVTRFEDGVWEGLHGPEVKDLDDVGAVLAGDA